MSSSQHCSECGAEIAGGKQGGLCTRCLLALGLQAASEPALTDDLAAAGPPLTTQRPSPATAFGDYELLEEIARGGMGIVYKARQVSLDRIVAVKLLLTGALSSPAYVKRFRVEASAAASLQHPNIVAVHEVGVQQGQHYLVMDYVDGPSLAKLVAQQPLPAKRAAGYVKTVAEAVHCAHEHGILHRDLKPSNILIDAIDQPRVTDFGLAKRFEGESEVTLSGQLIGSPGYMPPEQAAARRGKVSRRSDVYGLGATLYHLLTGRPPFQAATLTDTLDQVLNTEPVGVRLLNPAVPRDLETICLKCLEKEPAKRYPTAQMLAEDLGRFLNRQPVVARPISLTGRAWRWCRRNPRLAAATGGAVLVLLIGLAGVTWQWRRAESEALLARRNAYATDMKEVQRALEENDLGRAQELLNRYRPGGRAEIDLRSWEWRYLWARCQSEERFTLCQYSNAVAALAFSPDGKWLAVRRQGGAVALWDPVAKESVAEWSGAGSDKALAFAPRGTLLAWGNVDAHGRPSVRLQDIRTGNEFATLLHPTGIVSIVFSPDALKLATLDLAGTVYIWDLASQRLQRVFTNREAATTDLASEALSGVTRKTFPAPTDGTGGLWEPASAPAGTAPSFQGGALHDHSGKMLLSPDGRLLAFGSRSQRIRLWDWVSGEEQEPIRLPAPLAEITAMAFSPDSRLLAAGCGFGGLNLHVWDFVARRGVRLAGHRGWIMGLAFSPDGKRLASASTDQTVRRWDVERKLEVRSFRGNTDEIWALAWSQDGTNLVTGAKDGTVRFWDPASERAAPYVTLPMEIWFWGFAFLPDSKTLLAVTLHEGRVVSWEAATRKPPETLAFLGTNHISLDLSRDGRRLALCDTNGHIKVWDFPARQRVTNLVLPEAWTCAVIFSPRGHYLNAGGLGSGGRFVDKMWETATWHEVNREGINLKGLCYLSFSPDERTMAIGHDDGTVDWWAISTRKRLDFYDSQHVDKVKARYSPDGRHFAIGGMSDGRMLLWDLATREQRPIGRGYRSGLHDFAFTPDGRRLVTTGPRPNDVVKIWDVETGRDVAALPGEPGLFYQYIGFSPDGNTLFVNSKEGKSLLWYAPSWAEIGEIEKRQGAP